jgi:RNA polymerase sigma factor (sigma-70 family)
MTLRELMNKADRAAYTKQVPTVMALMESESPVITSERMKDDIEATAFQNGYVIYQNGNRATVFSLTDCLKAYVEVDQMGMEHALSFDAFADQPWQIRVFMEGERRLVHNSNNRRRFVNEISYDGFAEGGNCLADDELDPLKLLCEREAHEEELQKLYDCLDAMTEKQRFILVECVVKGRMHLDVAREMGTSRENVSKSLRRSLARLRNSFGVEERPFHHNRFYNPQD